MNVDLIKWVVFCVIIYASFDLLHKESWRAKPEFN